MSVSRWKSLLIVAAVVAVVLLGHTAGRIGELGALGCLSGVALAVGSFFRRPPIAPESDRWGAAFLLIYALIAIETDAIMWALERTRSSDRDRVANSVDCRLACLPQLGIVASRGSVLADAIQRRFRPHVHGHAHPQWDGFPHLVAILRFEETQGESVQLNHRLHDPGFGFQPLWELADHRVERHRMRDPRPRVDHAALDQSHDPRELRTDRVTTRQERHLATVHQRLHHRQRILRDAHPHEPAREAPRSCKPPTYSSRCRSRQPRRCRACQRSVP